jgi:putative hemolysin
MVNQVLGDNVIPTEGDFETLGGFLLAELGDLPEGPTEVEFHNYRFRIEEVKAHRLGRVRILRREETPEPAP